MDFIFSQKISSLDDPFMSLVLQIMILAPGYPNSTCHFILALEYHEVTEENLHVPYMIS